MAIGIPFNKYQAVGNDYLVISTNNNISLPDLARLICERHCGIGADGILVEAPPNSSEDFGVRIFNPDGSEAEKSGNGLRIFCQWLADTGRLSNFSSESERHTAVVKVWTLGGVVQATVQSNSNLITVQLGQIRFIPQLTNQTGTVTPESIYNKIQLGGKTYRAVFLNLGNPHFVIDITSESTSDIQNASGSFSSFAHQYGRSVEVDHRFPERTNVQFLESAEAACIQISIWERGAGYTLSSGSSACAAAAAAHRWGMCSSDVIVNMPGGQVNVSLDNDLNVTLTGSVTKVGQGIFYLLS